jgi:hypothetical protein
MAKSISVITNKKRGRPVTTGRGTLVGVRLLDSSLASLDGWIERQDEPELTRPEAIRRLVEVGLNASHQSVKQLHQAKTHADLAADLATEIGLKAEEK